MDIMIKRSKKGRKLPEVLSQDEVLKILNAMDNKKHRAILFMVYSAGLRVGEVVRLKITDIDPDRMLIHIVQGKGKKDRYTTLSEIALTELRNYAKEYNLRHGCSPDKTIRNLLPKGQYKEYLKMLGLKQK